jgi:mxaD protein
MYRVYLNQVVKAGVLFGTSLLLTNLAGSALAHGASPRKIDEKIEIAAKPEAVWAIIEDFAKISTWNPLVTKSVAQSDELQGKERLITLKSGKITDALTDYEAAKMTYSYRRVDDDVQVFPVSFYSATISVSPTATGSEVEWIGRFYRGDTSNEPPANLNDDAATKAMGDFFLAGLNKLKTLAEKK